MKHTVNISINKTKSEWLRFIEFTRSERETLPVKNLELEFSNCPFLEPFHLVTLACLVEEYLIYKVNVSFSGLDKKLKSYLQNVNFLNYWKAGLNRNNYIPSNVGTSLCLWKVDKTRIYEHVIVAQRYFENNFFAGKDLDLLNISLAELFNNIIDHSKSNVSGFSICQFYPKNNLIKICICDFGKGIVKGINDFLTEKGHPHLTADAAIVKALEINFSTYSQPHNRGFGLDNIKNIVLSSNGKLRIQSNEALYLLKNTSENIFIKDNFNGTNIEIVLDTTTFEIKDEQYFEDDLRF